MGGVCTGGTMKRGTVAEYGSDNGSLGFSGKLKAVKSFGQQTMRKKKVDYDYDDGDDDDVRHGSGLSSSSSSYVRDDNDVYHRKMMSYDSGELFSSISRELKPSTPARVSKVYMFDLVRFLVS